jgi:quercetin dioxygenase-like cupin family protein
MTKLKHVGPVVLLSAVITLFAGVAALATPPTDFVPEPLARGSLGQLDAQHDGVEVRSENTNADVAVSKVTIGPGGSSGWHHHPGVVLVSVASGTLTRYTHNCDKTVYTAGEGFTESDDHPATVQNEGNADVVVYVTYIVPSDTPSEGLLIDDPQPENCDLQAAADGSTSLASTGGPSLAAPFALAALVVVAGGSGVVALTRGRRRAQ